MQERSVILEDGDLTESLVSSMAMAELYKPIRYNNTYYVDGDVSSGYGVNFLREKGQMLFLDLKRTQKNPCLKNLIIKIFSNLY